MTIFILLFLTYAHNNLYIVLVFYCSYSKLSLTWKPKRIQMYHLIVLSDQMYYMGLIRKIKVFSGLHSFLEPIEKNSFPSSFSWHNSVSCGCRTEIHAEGHSQFLHATYILWLTAPLPPTSKPGTMNWIFLMPQTLFFQSHLSDSARKVVCIKVLM